MSGHVVTGVGPALVMYGYPGVGLCRRGKPLFGCQASGCAEQEVGCGSRDTGSKTAVGVRLSGRAVSGHFKALRPSQAGVTDHVWSLDEVIALLE
jgi:hypothetical protein